LHPIQSPSALENRSHLYRRPDAPACRRDTACRQCPAYSAKRMNTAPLNFTNYRQNIRRVAVCSLLPGRSRVPSGIREFRVAQAFAARLGGLQSSRCPCTDDFTLVLARREHASIMSLYESAPGQNLDTAKGTLWGVVNVVSYYVDHVRSVGGGDRLDSAWFGAGGALKDKAWVAACDLLNQPSATP
jgi:hypothetical protein